MRAGHSEIGAWETRKAEAVIRRARWRLAEGGMGSVGEMLIALHDWTLPLLERGRHMNPVHHTAVVAELMAQILLEEAAAGRADSEKVKIGMAAAVLHDAGNAFEPPGEAKITVEMVRTGKSETADALAQRRRHMDNGGLLAEAALRAPKTARWFASRDIRPVRALVENHDAPTLAELATDDKAKGEYLFHSPPGPPFVAPLSAILREADRLWMLTIDGVLVDLTRKVQRGRTWDPLEQLEHNTKRHQEERGLYENCFPAPTLDNWGFGDATAFYRTAGGKRLFAELQQQARAQPLHRWVEQVTEIWLAME